MIVSGSLRATVNQDGRTWDRSANRRRAFRGRVVLGAYLGHVLPDNRGHERATTDSRRVGLIWANPCDQER
jgi:hypothetical protein